jgi:hypothetical protein
MARDGSAWKATLGPFDGLADDGPITYTVTARDQAGNEATRSQSVVLNICPG